MLTSVNEDLFLKSAVEDTMRPQRKTMYAAPSARGHYVVRTCVPGQEQHRHTWPSDQISPTVGESAHKVMGR